MDDRIAGDVARDRIRGRTASGAMRTKGARPALGVTVGYVLGGLISVCIGVGFILAHGLVMIVLGLMMILSGLGMFAKAF